MHPWLAPDGLPWLARRWRSTLFPRVTVTGPTEASQSLALRTPTANAARLLCNLHGSGPLAAAALWALRHPHAR